VEGIFRTVLEMSITGSWVILAVLLARLVLRRLPKRYSYALWAVAGFRLCCPVSFASVVSLFSLPKVQTGAVVTQTRMPEAYTVLMGTGYTTPLTDSHTLTPIPTQTAAVNWMQVLAFVWLAGMAAMVLYAAVCDIRLRLRLRTAVRVCDHIWESEQVDSPFILGVIRPRIYLPCGLGEPQRGFVLAHEKCHLKHLDHIAKLLAFGVLTVHWFNPLCHLAFWLMGRDMEMRCDEAVLRRSAQRCDYSAALVAVAAERKLPVPSPLAFGESAVKSRVKNILRWKKPRAWAAALALVLCAGVILACAADPAGDDGIADGKYIIANGETGEDYPGSAIVEIRDHKLVLFNEIYDLADKQWEEPPFDALQWEGMLTRLNGAAPEDISQCRYMELFVLTADTLEEYNANVDRGMAVGKIASMEGVSNTVFLLRQGNDLYVCHYYRYDPTDSSLQALAGTGLRSDRLVKPGGPLDPRVQIYRELDSLAQQVLAQPGTTVAEKAAADEELYWTLLRHGHIMDYLCHVLATEGLAGEKGELMGILFEDVLMRRFEEPLIPRGDMTAAAYFEAYMEYALDYYSDTRLYMALNNASGPMLYHLQTHYDYGK